MILIKLLGAGFIFFASFFLGREVCAYERLKYKESEAFLNLIRHIRSEIACYKTPIPKIISSYSDKELAECGFLKNFDISWNEALEGAYERLHIDEEVKKLLQKFGEELGGPYKDEQISRCDYYAEKLAAKVALMKDDLPGKQKMYRTLSFVLGILAVIILF